MPESIEDEPEFCGWLRRNDPDVTNRAEAARIIAQLEEMLDEDVTGDHVLVTVYPHANLLMSPLPVPAKFWRGLFWGLVITLAGVLVVWLSVRAL